MVRCGRDYMRGAEPSQKTVQRDEPEQRHDGACAFQGTAAGIAREAPAQDFVACEKGAGRCRDTGGVWLRRVPNPPEVVVRAYQRVLPEFLQDFQVIEFAVYCAPHAMKNYEVFYEAFGRKNENV